MTETPEQPSDAARPARPATIYDVSRTAGVSISTASKALNGKGKLSTATRERVQAAAAQLGFRPNELAQSLLRGRSFTIGLVISSIYQRLMPLLTGIEDTLAAAQYSVFLCNTHDDPARERQHLNALLAKQVDGIIIAGRQIDPRPPIEVQRGGVPVVYAYSLIDDPSALCLLPDEHHGARLAVEHLLRLGRRRLAHIAGPTDRLAVRVREETMRRTLVEYNLDLPTQRIVHGELDEHFGYSAANTLLDRDPTIDAFFCGSDVPARGAVDAMRERGVRVPDDVAVVGYHNIKAIATAARPPLTSVDANLYELGRQTSNHLLSMIDGRRLAGAYRLPFQLVVRGSCGGGGRTEN
jgi:LacI family transcriptional regulator